jgi:hypothetical protein
MTGDFCRLSMRILYVIFVLCVGALVWAALAAARHIRRHEGKTGIARQPTPHSQETATKAEAEGIALRPKEAHHD